MFFILIPHKTQKLKEISKIIATIFAIIIMSAFMILTNWFLDFEEGFKYLNASGYLFVVTVRTFFGAQFIFASSVVRLRFKALNIHLLNLTVKKSSNLVHHDTFMVSTYSTLYHKLCDGIDMINSVFTFQLIFVFGITMVRAQNL